MNQVQVQTQRKRMIHHQFFLRRRRTVLTRTAVRTRTVKPRKKKAQLIRAAQLLLLVVLKMVGKNAVGHAGAKKLQSANARHVSAKQTQGKGRRKRRNKESTMQSGPRCTWRVKPWLVHCRSTRGATRPYRGTPPRSVYMCFSC